MGYAEDIKSMVSMPEVARAYGLRVNREGFALCPFHHEKTGSFKVYKGTGGWKCYGCGESGDVIDFVEKYFNLDFKEAMAKLNEDFHLGLPIGEKQTPRQRMEAAAKAYRARQVKDEKQRALEAAKSAYWEAYDRWLGISIILERLHPKNKIFGKICGQDTVEVWLGACHAIAEAEWNLEQAEISLYEAEKNFYN